uniref:Uncharacterized protein n=1 Tax=Ananas comosus var. bracteatus TaxID=296719 RepID=A0A6V7PS18_ANACO|nr:unnamed protein product [Ananas comosus var. bracteatus]
MAIGTRLQQQTTSYNQSFEGTLQITRDFNQKSDVLAQRIEALRKEEARRYEIMMEEDARRHEQLLGLIRSRSVHAKGKGTSFPMPFVKDLQKWKRDTPSENLVLTSNPILLRAAKRIVKPQRGLNLWCRRMILHEAEGAGSKQECDDYLQMEINERPEIALREMLASQRSC